MRNKNKKVTFGDDKIAGSAYECEIVDSVEVLQCNHPSKKIRIDVLKHEMEI